MPAKRILCISAHPDDREIAAEAFELSEYGRKISVDEFQTMLQRKPA